jgi:hypothetical protein
MPATGEIALIHFQVPICATWEVWTQRGLRVALWHQDEQESWHEQRRIRLLHRAYQNMSAEESESLKRDLAEIDKAAPGDGQSTPANITPV